MPELVPPDWVEWTGWSCECPFFYPAGGPSGLPSLQWTPTFGVAPEGANCEQAAYPLFEGSPWATYDSFPRVVHLQVQRDPHTGHAAVQVRFEQVDFAKHTATLLFVLFDLETNRPLSALIQPIDPDCNAFQARGHAGGRQVLFQETFDTTAPFGHQDQISGGWVSFDQSGGPPSMGTRIEFPDPDFPWEVRPALTGTFEWRNSGFYHAAWGGKLLQVTKGDPEELVVAPSGGALLSFPAQAVGRAPVVAWSPDTGLVNEVLNPLPDKTDEGVATDGVDIVWDRIPSNWKDHSPGSLMTAPFSLDPAVVANGTRAVKSVIRYAESAVGCGHSARRWSTKTEGTLEIVRLSDGGTWKVPETPEVKLVPLFLDCNTLYVRFERDVMGFPGGTLGRIRLDSLGPPTLPN